MAGSHIETVGTVVLSAHNSYKVELTEGFQEETLIMCTISGKIRMNKIQIMPGDRVRVKISPYDTSNGIIIARL